VTSEAQPERRPLRDRFSRALVTNMELFTDLVYIFAVTQLASHLRSDPTLAGTLQSLLLLAIFWLIWIHTTWITNWVDPECIEVRLLLVAGMLVSLAMAVAVPRTRALGLLIGGGYAVMVIGRSLFMVIVLRGSLERHFERVLAWRVVVGTLARFPTPGLGGRAPRTGRSQASTSPRAARRSS
jgi:low temperature requirement protein LtrA